MSSNRRDNASATSTSEVPPSFVSSSIQLPPISATIYQGNPGLHHHNAAYQDYTADQQARPRHVPAISSPTRSLSSSSSSTRRPGISSIYEMLNDPPSSPDRSVVSSTTGSNLASPMQKFENLNSSRLGFESGSYLPYRNAQFDPTRGPMPNLPLEEDNRKQTPVLGGALVEREQRSQHIPGLVGGTMAQDRARLKLIIRQQPLSARACGLGERDRRVIDPPPILQLCLDNFDPDSETDNNILKSPFNVVSCLLISATEDNPQSLGEDVSRVTDPNDPTREVRKLMGSLAMSPFITRDLHAGHNGSVDGRVGSYYIFSDLSCRQNGSYKLRFVLTSLGSGSSEVGSVTETAAVVESAVFTVYSAKDFPGMLASSDLTKKLRDLGASVPIKKGNEGRKKNNRHNNSGSDGSDG